MVQLTEEQRNRIKAELANTIAFIEKRKENLASYTDSFVFSQFVKDCKEDISSYEKHKACLEEMLNTNQWAGAWL